MNVLVSRSLPAPRRAALSAMEKNVASNLFIFFHCCPTGLRFDCQKFAGKVAPFHCSPINTLHRGVGRGGGVGRGLGVALGVGVAVGVPVGVGLTVGVGVGP